MPLVIESTGDQDQVIKDFESAGVNVGPAAGEKNEKPGSDAPDETTSVEPRDKTAEKPKVGGDEIVPGSEPGKKASQESRSQPKEVEDAETLSRSQAKKRIDKLTARAGTLQDELDLERSDKTKLQRQLDEVLAELEELKNPQSDQTSPKLVKPRRPTRPDIADFNHDVDEYRKALRKYDSDMDKYEDEMDEYNEKRSEARLQEAIESERSRRAQEDIERAANRQREEYNRKVMTEAKAEFPDWEEFWSDPDTAIEVPPAAETAILEDAEHPTTLLRYLAENPDEMEKLREMSEVRQVAHIARLDARAWNEHQAKKTSGSRGTTEAATNPPEDKTPAPPQPKTPRTPEPPLEPPRGSRVAVSAGNSNSTYEKLIAAGNGKGIVEEYNRRQAEKLKGRRP